MRGIDVESVRHDLFGGLAAGVVALPLALAFGVASGLGPAAGLYGAMATGIVAAIFGGTPIQITGPTGPMTLVVAGLVAANTSPDGRFNLPLMAGIFVLTGLFQILLGVFRAGSYIRYIPYPVISGFMSGIGVIIIIQQIFPFMGVVAPASDPFAILNQIYPLHGSVNWSAVGLAALAVAIAYILPRFTKTIPSSLVALMVLTLVAALFKMNVHVIGDIPSGFPGLVTPSFTLGGLGKMIGPAIQLGFLGAIDSLLTSLVADNITKTQHNSNRELIGQGLGNIAGALLGGIPGSGATTRTVVNINAGGRTRLAGVIHGLFLMAVLLGGSSLVKFVPNAVLAGLLVVVAIGIIDYRGIGHMPKVPRTDAFLMLLVLLLTVFAGLILAVTTGLILASFVFMKKLSDITETQTTLTPLQDQPWFDEEGIPEELRNSLFIKHVDGPLFFGFASQFLDLSRQLAGGRLLVLRMDRVSYMDQSGIYALQEALLTLKKAGVRLIIVGITIAHLDVLRSFRVVPYVVAEEDLFKNFADLKQNLPAILNRIAAPQAVA
ncbi:MAG: SulP family inorganic anion transporter [Candidatus Solibacter sp.]